MRLEDVRRARFGRGARGPDRIDCLGVTLVGCSQLGNPLPDPWQTFLVAWRRQAAGDPPLEMTGLPETWRRLEFEDSPTAWSRDVRDGDVWLWHRAGANYPGCGVVYQGRVWTATVEAGVVALEPHRAQKPDEVWRP